MPSAAAAETPSAAPPATGPLAQVAAAERTERVNQYLAMAEAEADPEVMEIPSDDGYLVNQPLPADDLANPDEPAQAAAPAAAAPAPGATPEAQAAPAQTEGEEPPEDWTFSSPELGEALKKSNLDPVLKKALRGAAFRDQQYKDAGFTPEDARTLKTAGFTRDRALRTAERLPTEEIELEVISAAGAFHAMQDDISTNPDGFVDQLQGWASNNPAVAPSVGRLLSKAHEVVEKQNAQAFAQKRWQASIKGLINGLRKNAQTDNDEVLAAIADRLEQEVGAKDWTPQGKTVDPDVERELTDLRRAKQQAELERQQAQVNGYNAFREHIYGTARQAVGNAIVKRLEAVVPSNFNPHLRRRIAQETFNRVEGQFFSNDNLVRTVEGQIRTGRRDQTHVKSVLSYIDKSVDPYISMRLQEVINEAKAEYGLDQQTTPRPAPAPPPKEPTASTGARRPAAAPAPTNGRAARQPEPKLTGGSFQSYFEDAQRHSGRMR
jgi:hypothetical protein